MSKPRDRRPREEIAGPSRKTREPTKPATLGNMRSLGPRDLDVTCKACGHREMVNVDTYPDDVTVLSFGPRLRCTKCGHLGASVRADWLQLRGMPGKPRQ